jgi:hypothetical protein
MNLTAILLYDVTNWANNPEASVPYIWECPCFKCIVLGNSFPYLSGSNMLTSMRIKCYQLTILCLFICIPKRDEASRELNILHNKPVVGETGYRMWTGLK